MGCLIEEHTLDILLRLFETSVLVQRSVQQEVNDKYSCFIKWFIRINVMHLMNHCYITILRI
jgi:hypothetical protein